MKLRLKITLLTGALALAAVPALAQAMPDGVPPQGKGKSADHQGGPEYAPPEHVTPGPKAGLPEKAKAYGRYCQGWSKKHVKGKKGTPFSECVTAMAKAANNESISAKKACKTMSKKHVKGEKGTEFSQCVKAANELRKQQRQKEKEAATSV